MADPAMEIEAETARSGAEGGVSRVAIGGAAIGIVDI
jgi:hypothetical protein